MDRIYVFSGLFSSVVPGFKAGTHKQAHMIKEQFPHAIVSKHVWNEWNGIADRIIAMKTPPRRLILIGHSNGVLACANIAERLRHHDIKVDYLGLVDPTAVGFAKIYNNVKRVQEIYATVGGPAVVRKITRGRFGAARFDKSCNA